ncbi:MAG: DUF3093 domain-containing protein [Actinomycetes bacterium]
MLYRERLLPPPLWWLLGAAFALAVLSAVGVAVGLAWGLLVAGCALLVTATLFWAAASVIAVTAGEVTVGRARLGLAYVGGCAPLDAEQTRRRTGPEADARAYLVLRPYVATAVEITLVDPDDPVPYWLISSRRPGQLAAAVSAALTARTA